MRLISDDGQVPAEALVAQGFGAAEPGQRGADDDDPAVALNSVTRADTAAEGVHDFAPSCVVQLVHDDRLHRAGRRGSQDVQAQGVVGIGVVHERLLTVQFENTSGASGTHCAYPWHRFRSTTIRISYPSFKTNHCKRMDRSEPQQR